MNKTKSIVIYLIGILLLFYGLTILFRGFNVGLADWILLAIGFIVLGVGLRQKNSNAIAAASFIIALGTGVILMAFRIIQLKYLAETFYISIGIGLLTSYFIKKKQSIFLYGSLTTFGLGIYFFIKNLPFIKAGYMPGVSFLILGVLLIVLFILEHKKWGYLPLTLSIFSYIIGIERLLLETNRINIREFNTVFSLTLIISGIILIIYYKHSRKIEKNHKNTFESEHKEEENVN